MTKVIMVLVASITAFFVYLSSPVSTTLKDTVFLADMTWLEVEEAVRQGKKGAIVPTAGLEQNGLHAILGKHHYVVKYAAEQIARQHGGLLVTPIIDYVPEGKIDPPSNHMKFSGTISIPEDVFAGILEFTARSLRAHGFKRIYFIGDSFGNQQAQAKIAVKLNSEWANTSNRVHHISDYYSANGQTEWLITHGEKNHTIGTHAGIRDTSELLFVNPDGIRPNMIGLKAGMHLGKTGSNGDPSRASKEIGETMIKLKIDAALKQIKSFQSQ
jgi:creatinine amidohydrolase